MTDKRLRGLSHASQIKKQEALDKTEKAIARLVSNKQKITIRAVAREAGVSISYIYKYPELSYKIQRLREQQKYSLVHKNRIATGLSKEAKNLREEKETLKQEIKELKDIIERIKTSKNSTKELREENIQLVQENIRLKKELKYTLINLQSTREFILEQGRIETRQQEIELGIKKVLQIQEE